jgi:tRNA(fMet)-specific endonuclease VapC
MLRYLLDTNIVSQPVSKKPAAGVLRRLRTVADQCAIAAPVWHELQYGCARLPAGKRRAALQDYLADVVHPSFEILPYDEAAALRHATERARLEDAGTPVPFVDGQIAAIALVNDLVLVTSNARDFAAFSSLVVENWT